MKKSKLGVLSVALPLGLGFSLALAACGGSDSDGSSNSGGKASGGTSASAAGNSNKAGSGGSTGNTAGNPGNTAGTSTSSGNGDVSGDTPIGDLTDDQFDDLCKDVADKFSGAEFDETGCKMSSLFATFAAQSDEEAQMLCKSAYDECKASPGETTDQCTKPEGECTATVDEMTACFEALGTAFTDLSGKLPSCDTVKQGDILTLLTQFMTLANQPACAAYQEKCPGATLPGGDVMP